MKKNVPNKVPNLNIMFAETVFKGAAFIDLAIKTFNYYFCMKKYVNL